MIDKLIIRLKALIKSRLELDGIASHISISVEKNSITHDVGEFKLILSLRLRPNRRRGWSSGDHYSARIMLVDQEFAHEIAHYSFHARNGKLLIRNNLYQIAKKFVHAAALPVVAVLTTCNKRVMRHFFKKLPLLSRNEFIAALRNLWAAQIQYVPSRAWSLKVNKDLFFEAGNAVGVSPDEVIEIYRQVARSVRAGKELSS